MVLRPVIGAALLALGACASPPRTEITSVRFAAITYPAGVARSNADLAEDFLDLTFALESGERLERLVRYEAPIRVHVSGRSLGPYLADIMALVERLRVEAGLDIALTNDDGAAQIHIEAVPAAQLSRVFPSAACFIVPGEKDWRAFLRRRPDARLRWSKQTELGEAAIFLPTDTAPQDVRDCLHEELTQALGPANDLYRLPDSIWNDDNLHGIATPFDMLMLRVLYQPELASGMPRAEVAKALPALFARENPKGRDAARTERQPESRAWARAIEVALARDVSRGERRVAAEAATQIALEMRPTDHRLAVSLLTLGRLTLRDDPALAARRFADAYAVSHRRRGDEDLRTAHAAVHVAAVALAAEEFDTTILLIGRHLGAALRGQNAVLAAGMTSLKAEALLAKGEEAAAREARLDSLRWARYGFGDEDGALAREQAAITAVLRIDEE